MEISYKIFEKKGLEKFQLYTFQENNIRDWGTC